MGVSAEQIMTAAIRHLNGDPTASMAELAEAVGVSRATLHRHFSSREELMLALGRRALERWQEAQEAAGVTAAAESGDRDRIEEALTALLTCVVTVTDEYGFALTDHAMAVHPELARRSDELEEQEIALYAAGQCAGLIRADLPARWVSGTVFGLCVAVREGLRRGDIARRDVPRLVHESFWHGAAPRGTS
ncbi:TetR/AcrR family transcriptional regulator [Nonomuraea sp. NPDC047897]|uniref:TetR/AcrR family transcriptional regulator n=1 Tax=Nonomuraea sp. NPDC047897 TaxID=3364346 RepID=UPI0037167826